MHLSQSLQLLVSTKFFTKLYPFSRTEMAMHPQAQPAEVRMKEGKYVYPLELNTLSIHLTRVLLRLQDCRVTSPFYCHWNNGIFDTGNWPPLWAFIPLWIIHNIRCICGGGGGVLGGSNNHPPPPPRIWNNHVYLFYFFLLLYFLLACLSERWWCVDVRGDPYPVSGKLTKKIDEGKKKQCRSPHPRDFFRAGAASQPACNVKTPPLQTILHIVAGATRPCNSIFLWKWPFYINL